MLLKLKLLLHCRKELRSLSNVFNGVLKDEARKHKDYSPDNLREHLEHYLYGVLRVPEDVAEEIVRRFLKENK